VWAAEGKHDGAMQVHACIAGLARSRAGRLTAALALFGALALGAAAPARSTATGWSAAVTVSAPHDLIGNLGLASGASADMVSWHFYDLAPPARQILGPPGASYAVAPVFGPFGAQRGLPASYASGPLVALGGGEVAQLILRRTGVNTARPSVAIGDVSGRFGSPLPVAGTVWVGRASLAGNRNGELLLAWISSPRTGHRQVWASVRLPGRGFAAPQLISSSANGLAVTASVGPGSHALATGRTASDMVVAFDSKRGRMLVRVRPHGRGWGAVADIGPAAVGNANEVATPYVGRNGRIVVGWYHRQLSETREMGPSYTQIAVRPPDRGRFLPAQTLAKSQSGPPSGDVALVGGQGYPPLLAFLATASSREPTPARSVVRVSSSHGNRFSAARTISPAGQWTTGVAATIGPRGPIVTWLGGPNPPSSARSPGAAVYAALATPAGNQFSAAVEVSPAEHVQSAVPLHTENGDRWIIAWSGLPQFLSPQSTGRSVVRVTTCSTRCG
jgi:hypothetical protein